MNQQKDKQDTNKKATKKPISLSLRDIYFQVLFFGLMVSLGGMVSPIPQAFLGAFGLLFNMAIIFCSIGFILAIKEITLLNMEQDNYWKPLALMGALCLFFLGENLDWGLLFIFGAGEPGDIRGLQDLLAAAFVWGIEIDNVVLRALVDVMRLALFLFLVFGAWAFITHKERVSFIWNSWKEEKWFLFVRTFLILFLFSIPIRTGFVEEMAPLEVYLSMGMSLSLLVAVFCIQPVSSVSNYADGDG